MTAAIIFLLAETVMRDRPGLKVLPALPFNRTVGPDAGAAG